MAVMMPDGTVDTSRGLKMPDPIEMAQMMAAQGQTIPAELQKQVFQQAAAENMSGQQLEQMFNMPAGTASQAAQALGIADQVPQSLGGSMAAPGTPPPIPPERPMADPGFPDPPPSKVIPDLPTGIMDPTEAEPPRTLPPPRPPKGDTRIIQPDPTKGETFLPYNTSPYTAPDRNYDITGYGTMGEPAAGWGGGAQGLTEGDADFTTRRDTPETIVGNNQPPAVTTPQQAPQYTQEEIDAVVNAINSGETTVAEVASQYGVSPDYVQSNLDQINKQNVTGQLPAADGDYTEAEVNQVADLINSGQLTTADASQFYGVPEDEIKQNLTALAAGKKEKPESDPKGRGYTPMGGDGTAVPGGQIDVYPDAPILIGRPPPREEPESDPGGTPVPDLPPPDGDYTQTETKKVADLINSGKMTAKEVADYYGVDEDYVLDNVKDINADDPNRTATDVKTTSMNPASHDSVGLETGLGGAERALAAGTASALTGVQRGTTAATNQITGGETSSRGDINQAALNAGQSLTAGTNAGMQALGAGLQTGRQDLATGAQAGLTALGQGLGTARGDIASGTAAGLQALGQGLGSARQDIMGGAQTGLQSLYEGIGGARGDVTGARDEASQQISQAFGRGEGMFNPYQQGGQQAHQNQLALSGALGQEAFDQAYQASPQMKFLQEQGERAIARNAAKTGGLGGGNVQKELLKYGQGVASQDLQNQIGNLQALSGQGLQAAGSASGLAARGGEAQANLQTGAGQRLSDLNLAKGQGGLATLTGTGQQLGQLGVTGGTQGLQAITGAAGQLGQMAYGAGGQGLGALQRAGEQSGQMAMTGGTQGLQAMQGLGSNLANVYGQQGINLADISSRAAQDRANYNMQGGLRGADYAYNTGQQMGSDRLQAGRDIAGNVRDQMAALANLRSQQGIGMSGLYGQQGNTLAAILGQAGANTANQINQAAANRQNAALNAAAGQQALIGGIPSKGPGILDSLGKTAAGVGSVMTGWPG